jgi:putative addiction module component (TIGR02574 family)
LNLCRRGVKINRYNLQEVYTLNIHLLKQASVLAIDEQIELAQAIWNGIVAKAAVPAVTPAQKAELDNRLSDHLSNPHDVISWGDVKAKAIANASTNAGQ